MFYREIFKERMNMKFCSNCGKQLNDDAMFCSGCGSKQVAAPQPQQPVNGNNAAPVNNYNAAPVPPVTGEADVQQNRGIAWLAYASLLLLVPLFARKRSEYCKFHVKQGATLCAVEIVYYILEAIIMAIVKAIFPGQLVYGYFTYYYQDSAATIIFRLLFAAGSIFLLVLTIMGIVNAATGKQKKLPLIGQIPFVEMLMDKIYAALNK